jgi:hypothetical protein
LYIGNRKSGMKTALLAAFAVFFYACVPASAQEKPFLAGQATVTMSATGSSTAVQIQTGASNPNLRIYNAGTVAVFVNCGGATITAAVATAMPIAPGTVEVIGCAQTHVAGITGGTAATVYLTPGSGL